MHATATTHDLALGEFEVSKQFVAWQQGEPDREWDALMLLDAYLRGLAPKPLRRGWDRDRPVVVMSRLPGKPLGDRALTTEQTAALATAMAELHAAVPARELAHFPQRIWHHGSRTGTNGLSAQPDDWSRPYYCPLAHKAGIDCC